MLYKDDKGKLSSIAKCHLETPNPQTPNFVLEPSGPKVDGLGVHDFWGFGVYRSGLGGSRFTVAGFDGLGFRVYG